MREDCDYYEVAPETLWRPDSGGHVHPNGFHASFARLREATGRPFVAHGVGYSVGSVNPDPARRERWLARIAADHRVFDFLWYTDHFGVSRPARLELTLPLPLPMTPAAAAVVRRNLAALQAVVPDVGVENSVFYFHLGSPLDEPAFLADALSAPRTHLLLDLHNVYTTAANAGFDPWEYVRRLPLHKVIEIHLSGGSDSDAAWLPDRSTLRLDAHDAAVPDDVWRLFERVLPLVPNLRGVTLERMEGTVEQSDVPALREELGRIRTTLGRRGGVS